MAIVGAYARIDLHDERGVRRRLAGLPNVELFELRGDGKVGLLIEATDLDAAHGIVQDIAARVEGVLGVWPVFADTGAELEVTGKE